MAQPNLEQPVNIYLSMATIPAMGVLIAATAFPELIVSIGLASEEIFRGDRLPLLKKPKSPLPLD